MLECLYMRIAVLGANGRTGKVFVQAALAAGHEVVAGTRHPTDFPEHPSLTIQHCDATDEHDVRRLVARCDAVVSLIGHVRHSPFDLQIQSMQIIISVMESLGVQRLISLTGTGVRFPNDHISLLDKILNGTLGLVDPSRIQDGRSHVELIKSTDLDWTIIRVLKLRNGPAGPFRLRPHGPAKLLTARKEVAKAILRCLEDDKHVRQAPIIGH